MRKWIATSGLALALGWPVAARAQVPVWDAPSFQSPVVHNDLGVYFLKPTDTDWGFAGTWESGESRGLNLGVRGQFVQIVSGLTQWGVGATLKGGIGPVAPPLLIDWTGGIGATSGAGVTVLRIPVGLSLGARLASPGLVLIPYVHPRVSFAYFSFDQPQFGDFGQETGSTSELEFDTDLGLDVDLMSPIIIRIGYTIGGNSERNTFGAGIAFKLGHRY